MVLVLLLKVAFLIFCNTIHGTKISESKQNHSVKSTKKEGLKRTPILDDSSTDDEASEAEGPTAFVNESASQLESSSRNGIRSTTGVWQESFFFEPNDSRLKGKQWRIY